VKTKSKLLTVATAITKAALLEHWAISSSRWMIFLILVTRRASIMRDDGKTTGRLKKKHGCAIHGRADWPLISSEGGMADVL
jgi:hypothetical protein